MNKQKHNPKIAIIGAGASGLAAAIFLSQHNISSAIFEKNNKIGKKLLATGNGKCNLTNQHISIDNFHTSCETKKELKKLLNIFDFNSCKKFFETLGVELLYRENGRAYPMSSSSASVVDALTFANENIGTKILTNTPVESIEYENNKFIINGTQQFDIVVLAAGSSAMPKLGGTSFGYQLAKKFAHTIIEPQPSLVQLVANNKNLDMISGVKLTGTVNNHTGDIRFTKYGVSGSAILDISRDIAIELQTSKEVKISIDIAPQFPKEQLKALLQKRVKSLGERKINLWLDGIFHKKLAHYIIQSAKIPAHISYAKQLGTKEINKIVHTIKNLSFTIIDTKGFDHCEVCSGGIDLSEINLNTMESKKQKGLYITGEILDIDGDCGGYNLHFAWASAYTATKAITQQLPSAK